MERILVTGANSGLGFEICRQLALIDSTKKVILACRNEDKANQAIERLVKLTNKQKDLFDFAILDTSDLKSCKKAAENLNEKLDGFIANAGGMNLPKGLEKGELGVLHIHEINVLGHAAFLQKAIDGNKLNENAKLIFSGSEAAVGVKKLNMKPPVFKTESAEEIREILSGKIDNLSAEIAYSYTKGIGALYWSSLARKYPSYYFLTISPGMTAGTSILSNFHPIKQWAMKLGFQVMRLTGSAHSTSDGAKRYLDGLQANTEQFPSGTFLASEKNHLIGKLVDQKNVLPEVYGEDKSKLQETVRSVIEELINQET